ncbi:hypothetical protein Cgig2_012043 [Carnegiea gigantea]|uniref:Reverse transcriptase n=1 Tax=Carnegiea gigantea TaxID=171969 RepID=A0A9Q1KQX1_9CARY|nr:hypothetical protein Cgig2_012043 [Carnegiea gigantea]
MYKAGSKKFMLILKELIRKYDPKVVSLPKTRISGQRADEICRRIGFEGIHKVEAQGFSAGMPATNGRITKQTFAYVLDSIDKRLVGWTTKTLSPVGRATSVQSIIFAIHYYSMQSAKLLCSLCDDYDRKPRKFLWGGNVNIGKFILFPGHKSQGDKDAGGLSFKSMRQVHSKFMTKLRWRVLAEKDSLWSRVLRAKYCQERCDIDMSTPKQDVSNAWQGPIAPQYEDATVEEMWDLNNGWLWDLFEDILPTNVLKAIIPFEVRPD